MTADQFARLLPPHVKAEFVAWLAKRDRKIGLRQFQAGYEHGYHAHQMEENK